MRWRRLGRLAWIAARSHAHWVAAELEPPKALVSAST
jgi:hypothetical protein